ncbi:hypothetical protein L3Q82_022103 [Scortum barcoo]|uniref:Uncharacterized protein n=1 Tax=Scortum barcoo TaxID=214431 RepID=A0ACB8X1R6_9TELE|nr:hypothetical protein L3Q82_022103 [Scortum barcoo]
MSHPGGGLGEDPGHAGDWDYVSLAWPGNASGSLPEELEEVSGVREVWASLLRLLPPRPGPGPKKRAPAHQRLLLRAVRTTAASSSSSSLLLLLVVVVVVLAEVPHPCVNEVDRPCS